MLMQHSMNKKNWCAVRVCNFVYVIYVALLLCGYVVPLQTIWCLHLPSTLCFVPHM